jgi:type VI secretion system secreted protein VgrG
LDLLQGVVDEVGKLAEHHAGDEATGHLIELADKIRHWHSGSNVAPDAERRGAPIVAVTSPRLPSSSPSNTTIR